MALVQAETWRFVIVTGLGSALAAGWGAVPTATAAGGAEVAAAAGFAGITEVIGIAAAGAGAGEAAGTEGVACVGRDISAARADPAARAAAKATMLIILTVIGSSDLRRKVEIWNQIVAMTWHGISNSRTGPGSGACQTEK